ncbi:MAG: lytic transglycosylase domain-containing protein [Woeseiaceae bacterium]
MMQRSHFVTAFFALLPLVALATTGQVSDPESAWKNYAATGTAIEPRYRFPHASCFRAAAVAYNLPETLLLAVARGESDFEPTARSKANAHGVMQILWPTTARHLGIYRLSELYDPCTNIDAGARYLKELVTQFDGDLHLALAAYNYGPQRISANTGNIPDGARWYSGYIFRHLNYVLGDGTISANAVKSLYSELGRSTLVEFAEPYRASAFVSSFELSAPDVQLDWFRKGVGQFSVELIYENKKQFEESAVQLSRAGFPLN